MSVRPSSMKVRSVKYIPVYPSVRPEDKSILAATYLDMGYMAGRCYARVPAYSCSCSLVTSYPAKLYFGEYYFKVGKGGGGRT